MLVCLDRHFCTRDTFWCIYPLCIVGGAILANEWPVLKVCAGGLLFAATGLLVPLQHQNSCVETRPWVCNNLLVLCFSVCPPDSSSSTSSSSSPSSLQYWLQYSLLLTVILAVLGVVDGTAPVLVFTSAAVGWVYLRFYQHHSEGRRGDLADSFACTTFFPENMQ